MKRFILFSLMTFSVLASCSKEKTIEHHLSRKDGIWYINKLTELDYKDGNQTDMYVGMNWGFFQFQDSGTGTITSNGYIESFNWSNTKDQLLLESDGTTINFTIVEESRKFITLNYVETETIGSSVYTHDYTYELEKK